MVIYTCLHTKVIAAPKAKKNPPTKVVSCIDNSLQKIRYFSNSKLHLPLRLVDKKLQYLDQQTIFGYIYSPRFNSVMNMHPELGLSIGYKKYKYTSGISGSVRFIKTRKEYTYYFNNDTLITRYFVNLPFSFFIQKNIWNKNRNSLFVSLAPGFEVLYLERQNATFIRSRATAISFHANTSLGYRYTKPDLHYYQATLGINYNNFSYGHVTNIPAQWYFGLRLAFGFLAKDEWATKRNYGK